MMKKFIFLGMAIQAGMTGLLTLIGLIDPKPGQQFIAAGVFILLFILFKSQEKKKKKETTSEGLIDCDTAPFVPMLLRVEEHRKTGLFKFDPTKISLYLSERQGVIGIYGRDLVIELSYKPVMNANVLDYLLTHPELIPEDWKNKNVFFWGTIYRHMDGFLCVRFLNWNGSKWIGNYSILVCGILFDSRMPAAIVS